uniref:DNA 3'-5' helicase n=1 Tax=Desulfatirhabdium butyrativorans TaxID=340467 RepID=A0A7C4RU69_9BACT
MDMWQFDLSHPQLIEASAGTGKTWQLTELYLRLVAEGFGVDRLLAVTFTEAATAELRDRIRSKLRNAWMALSSGSPPSTLEPCLHRDGLDVLKRRLFEATLLLDEAQIFTIHGFCHTVLRQYAFETGMPFDAELLQDNKSLAEEIAADWWSKTLYSAPPWLVGELTASGESPEAWADLLIRAAARPDLRILPEAASSLELAPDIASLYQDMQATWKAEKDAILDILDRHLTSLNARSYSKQKLALWKQEIDVFLAPEEPLRWNPPEGVTKLGTTCLRAAARKNASPPSHPFFDQCQRWVELFDEAADRRILLKRRFLDFGLTEWRTRKARRQILDFDDLVLRLYACLNGPQGDTLAEALRIRYPAALVDEFQDTDPYQYGIFRKIYVEGARPFFMIGDPKQAIYAFRGADIHAYFEAANQSRDRTWRLDTNHRSDGTLVAAVNALFQNAPLPFVDERIRYESVSAARPGGSFRLQGRSVPPFRLIYVRSDAPTDRNPKGTLSIGRLRSCIPRFTAQLLVDWLQQEPSIDDREVHPGQMAVLVRTNAQAFDMLEALGQANLPAVLESTHSVWETLEAKWIWYLLRAVLEPENRNRILTALGCGLFGTDAHTLHAINRDEGLLDRWIEGFRRLRTLWRKHGVFTMLDRTMRGELDPEEPAGWVRLAQRPSGERMITNVLHLAELLEKQSRSGAFGALRLVQWMETRMNGMSDGSEDSQLRLESDAEAVQIVTIHKSKGLEYPIVFCPYLWDLGAGRPNQQPLFYHDPAAAERLTLHLVPGEPEQEIWKKEQLSESMRLLYVAVTRARNACAVWTAGIRDIESSALGRLLHPDRSAPQDAGTIDDMLLNDLHRLAQAAPNAIDVTVVDMDSATDGGIGRYRRPGQAMELVPPPKAPAVSRRWRISSFSELIRMPLAPEEIWEGKDIDGLGTGTADEAKPSIYSDAMEIPLADVDAGTQTGLLLHGVFETIDFTDPQSIAPAVERQIQPYGHEPGKLGPVLCRAVRDVLEAPLDPDEVEPRLSCIPPSSRLTEMGFLFPTADAGGREAISPHRLAELWTRSCGSSPLACYAEHLRRLSFPELQGYLKGFIDLVFIWKKRWYIVDYKSNHLGRHPQEYAQDRLEPVMFDHHYLLQAVIYTLALHRYLSVRLPGYAYDKDIGTVYYLFIRGMGPQYPPGNGVYRFKPPFALIAALENLFGNRS